MAVKTQIIDVFAGPGGLGEGFSAFQDDSGNFPFEIKVSIEMECFAHKTLRLRAFLRYFKQKGLQLPQIYIDYVSGKSKLLGKLLEFREMALLTESGQSLNENEVFDEQLIAPENYCPNDYEQAKQLYKSEWNKVEFAVKKALNEALRMTLGPDETAIHEAIATRICKKTPRILIGGPPCQAFSMVGRSRRKGKVTTHVKEFDEDGNGQWNQDDDGRTWLYREYIKIIHHFEPEVFVMENVRGMMSAMINDCSGDKVHVWKRIFSDLSSPAKTINAADQNLRYDIYSLATEQCVFRGETSELEQLNGNSFVLHAEKYGIPQNRERVILLGIRKDVSNRLGQSFMSCLRQVATSELTTVQDAIGDLPAIRAGLGCLESVAQDTEGYKTSRARVKKDKEESAWVGELAKKLTHTLDSLKKSQTPVQKKVYKLFNAALKEQAKLFKKSRKVEFVESISFVSTNESLSKFNSFDGTRLIAEDEVKCAQELRSWYGFEGSPKMVLNHQTRTHMDSDLCRYMYSASYGLVQVESNARAFPCLPELEEVNLDPKGHKNRKTFIDRYRTQILNKPATTVTSHISKDGHYFIHPDPSQMRSMTVREAARIQTFPDDYFFEGPRTAQYIQVGNAVPPLLANKIAGVVFDVFIRSKTIEDEPQLALNLEDCVVA